MKRLLAIFLCILFLVSLMSSCGKKEEAEQQTPAVGEPEEVADTTRMDSAMQDSDWVDSATVPPDSM